MRRLLNPGDILWLHGDPSPFQALLSRTPKSTASALTCHVPGQATISLDKRPTTSVHLVTSGKALTTALGWWCGYVSNEASEAAPEEDQ